MIKYFNFLLIILMYLSSCNAQRAKVVAVQRDTTITPATAFSPFFLDSTRLEAFIKEDNTTDSASEQLRKFYAKRNYQFAWFTEDGIAEHTRLFWNLHNSYINYFGDTALIYKTLHTQIDLLFNADSTVKLSNEKMLQTELMLTKHFFAYSKNAYTGKVDAKELQWYIPQKKLNAVTLLDSFIARDGKNLDNWEPVNIFYKRLKQELIHYYNIDKAGGWETIGPGKIKKYNPGDSALIIKQVKQRLHISGEYNYIDTTSYYNSTLIAPIKMMQKSFGLSADGSINDALIKELNIPVKERLRQLMINLERMRWVPDQPEGKFLIANIPEFRLHIFEGKKKLFSINIVVGKAAHSTVIFTDKLKYVVFSPYWNIPPSIVRNEILPAIRRNANYLSKMNMEKTGYEGGLPVIRQKPGGANALGRVKFIFPTSYNIYFHDTPSKSLFREESRAFSHGCMRLAEPEKLAAYLLQDQPEWSTQKMNEAMSSSIEKWVVLKEPVPVFITYFTSWVDSDGLLNFREDIYGHDKKLAMHLFQQ